MTLGSASELYKLLIAGSVFLPEKNSTAEGRRGELQERQGGQRPATIAREVQGFRRPLEKCEQNGWTESETSNSCLYGHLFHFLSLQHSDPQSRTEHRHTHTHSPHPYTLSPIHTPYLIYYYLCSLCRSHHTHPVIIKAKFKIIFLQVNLTQQHYSVIRRINSCPFIYHTC